MRTQIAATSAEAITIRGRDLTDLMGELSLTELMLLSALGRMPERRERVLVDAILVSLAEHGLTPSSMAARLTHHGAPEAWQASVAAGLLGAGSVFLGAMQQSAALLIAGAARLSAEPTDEEIAGAAHALMQEAADAGEKVRGLGHPVHRSEDPRVARLREIAAGEGFRDVHWRLLDALPAAAAEVFGRHLPINNVGAVGACIAALGYPPEMGRGLGLAARAAGLIAHLMEESSQPLAAELWQLALTHTEGAQ